MDSEIFISYCRKDLEKVKKIKKEIENIIPSVKCWMDLDGIESGTQFEDVIIKAIDQASIVVFMLSDNSMNSKWTKDEIRYAYNTKKKIIPVNIDNCTPSGWFLFKLSAYDVININNSLQRKKLFEDLVEWFGNKEKMEEIHVSNKKPNNRIFYCFGVCQYVFFGLLLLTFSSMFFFGLLTMKEGTIAMRYNILLCLSLGLSLYSTYLLFTKKKKSALYFICILDVIEIILFSAVSKRVAGYGLLSGYHYRSFPYVQINELGLELYNKGVFLVTSLRELFALLHILLLLGILFVRIKGDRLWDSMK